MNDVFGNRSVVDDVVAFCRLFGTFEREQVCCGSVTVAQCVVLQTLLEGTWDASSLATETRVTKGAMTRLLDGLQERGFVERQRDPDDGRRSIIALTKAGTTEAKRLRKMTASSVELIFSKLSATQRKHAESSLRLLREAVEEVRDQLDCC